MRILTGFSVVSLRVFALCAVILPWASAAAITVTNDSFEDPVVTTIPGFNNSTAGPFCFATTACPSIPGWELSGLGGLFQPNNSVFPAGSLDGTQVFFTDGRSVEPSRAVQTLSGVTYQQNVSYTLTVTVGNRAEGFIPFGGGAISLFKGTDQDQIVATLDLSSIMEPSPGQLTNVMLFVSASDVAAANAVGESIGIRLDGASIGQTIFDKVQLSAVPVPAALPLLASALVGFGFVARRRSRTHES